MVLSRSCIEIDWDLGLSVCLYNFRCLAMPFVPYWLLLHLAQGLNDWKKEKRKMEAAARNGGGEKHKNKTRTKKKGLWGGIKMKRLPSKDVKRKSRKNEHFQIFKFLIFGGFISVLCPTPTPWRLYTRLTRHKMLHYNVAPHTHTHTIIFLWIGSIGWGRERQVLRVFLAFYFQTPKLEREHGMADR